jgi:hypothetical protein
LVYARNAVQCRTMKKVEIYFNDIREYAVQKGKRICTTNVAINLELLYPSFIDMYLRLATKRITLLLKTRLMYVKVKEKYDC